MKRLTKEYHYEPVLGLEAGQDGLDVVSTILDEAHKYLAGDGLLVVEVGNSANALIEKYPSIPFMWRRTTLLYSMFFLFLWLSSFSF